MAATTAPRLLIVDDHAGFRRSARMLLESEGFDIVGEADCGLQGVRAARELNPDVMLLDVHLPDFDGFEVAERLARDEHPPKIVLTSARADLRCLEPGTPVRGFIPKEALSGRAVSALVS